MGRRDDYRTALRAMPARSWDAYLTEHSGLPGPRANLELLAAVAEECPSRYAYRLAAAPDEYLAMCGAASLGRIAGDGDPRPLPTLRQLAAENRWRVREAVAIGLQRLGDADPAQLRRIAGEWAADPNPLIQRTAIAGICEPRLLADPETAHQALEVLDAVTADLVSRPASQRRAEAVRTLRQALGYCWSVATAASPEDGFDRLDRWAASDDADVRWIINENLKKARLAKADSTRHARLRAALVP